MRSHCFQKIKMVLTTGNSLVCFLFLPYVAIDIDSQRYGFGPGLIWVCNSEREGD